MHQFHRLSEVVLASFVFALATGWGLGQITAAPSQADVCPMDGVVTVDGLGEAFWSVHRGPYRTVIKRGEASRSDTQPLLDAFGPNSTTAEVEFAEEISSRDAGVVDVQSLGGGRFLVGFPWGWIVFDAAGSGWDLVPEERNVLPRALDAGGWSDPFITSLGPDAPFSRHLAFAVDAEAGIVYSLMGLRNGVALTEWDVDRRMLLRIAEYPVDVPYSRYSPGESLLSSLVRLSTGELAFAWVDEDVYAYEPPPGRYVEGVPSLLAVNSRTQSGMGDDVQVVVYDFDTDTWDVHVERAGGPPVMLEGPGLFELGDGRLALAMLERSGFPFSEVRIAALDRETRGWESSRFDVTAVTSTFALPSGTGGIALLAWMPSNLVGAILNERLEPVHVIESEMPQIASTLRDRRAPMAYLPFEEDARVAAFGLDQALFFADVSLSMPSILTSEFPETTSHRTDRLTNWAPVSRMGAALDEGILFVAGYLNVDRCAATPQMEADYQSYNVGRRPSNLAIIVWRPAP